MLKKHFFLLFAFLCLPALALAQVNNELFDYYSLDLELLMMNEFRINPTSGDFFIDHVSAELTWFPREDYRQDVDYISSSPRADFNENIGFLFEWNQPTQQNFDLELESVMTTKNDFTKVNKKIDFPIIDLDPSYAWYLKPQQIIDINNEIRQIASSVVQGEDDLFRAVYKIADWVDNNVEYDLSTITAEATQKASWVLDNKKGVCDEITSLFIAMCRSVGIPARFVAGISYSNINLQNDGWGPHGWAEVYFPNIGWVPFDVTYHEFGYIDAVHIKLKTTADAKESSINYVSRSRNTELEPGKLKYDVTVLKQGSKVRPLLDLEAEVAEAEVGFGSYNLLILTIKNPNSYYVTSRISLANVNRLEVLDENIRSVLLAPREEKKLYWRLRVNPNLKTGYIYTFPLEAMANRGEQVSASFQASKQWKIYSEEYLGLFMITEQLDEKLYSKNVLVTCSATNDKIYLNEAVNISCMVDNKGDQTLRGLKICLGIQCSTTRLLSKDSTSFEYTKQYDTLGVKTLVFRVENELVEKSYYTIIDVQDKPLLEIANLSYPKSMSYEDLSEVQFFVKKKSNTNPQTVNIRLEHELMEEEWDVPDLERDYKFIVVLKGKYLTLNQNDFKITVTYNDAKGNIYKVKDEFSIKLKDPTILQKIMIWFNILDHKLSTWIGNI
ncbi:hypothetical protein AYK26_05315 [Euryarchaeota archaeon SM23-78]|nr:MAG: hypothetical protein AYK26_05315 [Euryarchaeota archaeon SM23-78]